ncbi:hypothetical protein [Salinarimonas soli]|uniref:Uncharacterized protein n=1 Tax=Salinarimonas soli TaxID=1638099 RepID=A0A5B2VBB3_9HYPH|nr:hypothetical protein [Salinarimonas soli]KAA2235945.1 hypothetical protein F0L46_17425 [Salinarimonas soli]
MDMVIVVAFIVIILSGAVLLMCGAVVMQHHEDQAQSTAHQQHRSARGWIDSSREWHAARSAARRSASDVDPDALAEDPPSNVPAVTTTRRQ